jgi:hypothetical protein
LPNQGLLSSQLDNFYSEFGLRRQSVTGADHRLVTALSNHRNHGAFDHPVSAFSIQPLAFSL